MSMTDDSRMAEPKTAMRNPLVVVLFAALCGIAVDRYVVVAAETWWTLAVAAWLLWLVAWRTAAQLSAVLLLVTFAATAACWHNVTWSRFDATDLGRYARLERTPVCVEATALASPRRVPAPARNPLRAIPVGERSRLDVEIVAIRDGTEWHKASGHAKLLVDGHLLGVHAGDRIQVFAQLAAPTPAMNPGEFDFAVHARRNRELCVLQTSYPHAVTMLAHGKAWTPRAVIDRLRSHGNDQLWRELSHEQSGLAAAIMLGSREQIGREWKDAFFQTGTVHLMAISGLHVGMLALGLGLLLRFCMVREQRALMIVAIACTLYVLVTDARPPAVRALIIVLTLCLGRLLGRQASGWNTLALAGIVVLAINPTEMFRTGTQLSFLAVAVLIALARMMFGYKEITPLERLIADSRPLWHKAGRWCAMYARGVFIASTAIWIIALPLVMAKFHLVPTIGLMLGPVLWIFVAVALSAGFLLLIFGWLWQPLAALFASICDASLGAISYFVQWGHGSSYSHAWVAGPPDWWLLGFYGSLAALLILGRHRPRRRWFVAFLAVWVAVGFAAALPKQQRNEQLACTFISVGHGSCVLVELPDGRNLLYDAGRLGSPESAARSISSYLWHRGIRHLDAVVVSHADVDHYNAIPELLERFSVAVVYVSPVMFEDQSSSVKALEAAIQQADVPVREVWLGDRLATGDETQITVMHPPQGGVLGSDNANSIVLLIEYRGHRILLPGDLEDLGMTDLMAEPPVKCDVILAPHHGSTRSNPPGFAAWCEPMWTIVSGGIDRDVSAVTADYEQAGSHVLHAGRDGAVRCVIDADGLTVDTWRTLH